MNFPVPYLCGHGTCEFEIPFFDIDYIELDDDHCDKYLRIYTSPEADCLADKSDWKESVLEKGYFLYPYTSRECPECGSDYTRDEEGNIINY